MLVLFPHNEVNERNREVSENHSNVRTAADEPDRTGVCDLTDYACGHFFILATTSLPTSTLDALLQKLSSRGSVSRISRFYCFLFVPALTRVKASSALNGYCRTDCCPVPIKAMSTRRFCASVTTFKFFRILSFCS